VVVSGHSGIRPRRLLAWSSDGSEGGDCLALNGAEGELGIEHDLPEMAVGVPGSNPNKCPRDGHELLGRSPDAGCLRLGKNASTAALLPTAWPMLNSEAAQPKGIHGLQQGWRSVLPRVQVQLPRGPLEQPFRVGPAVHDQSLETASSGWADQTQGRGR